jgi:hypothetical protein
MIQIQLDESTPTKQQAPCRRDMLDDARKAVALSMFSRQTPWTRRLPRPAPDHWLMRSMDSVVADTP